MRVSRLALITYGLMALAGLSLGAMSVSMDASPVRFIWLFVLTAVLSILSAVFGFALIVQRFRRRADRVADMLAGRSKDAASDPTDRMIQ